MSFSSDRDRFYKLYEAGKPQVIVDSYIADLDTPVSTYLKLSDNETYSFLLESVENGEVRGRYSIIGIKPDLLFRVQDGIAEINRDVLQNSDRYVVMDDPPLDALKKILEESSIDMPDDCASMAAGIFGYMGYDMIRYMEDIPSNNIDVLHTPEMFFIRPTVIVVFDDVTHRLQFYTAVYPDHKMTTQKAYNDALTRLKMAHEKLQKPMPMVSPKTVHDFGNINANMTESDYCGMVDKAKKYIVNGDIFQVVLSQQFKTRFELPAFDLYRVLRRINPSPYLFFLQFEDFAIVGSSPEILITVTKDEVNIRPIAGTRHRGNSVEEDEAIIADLLRDKKECAEHLMLLDLGRNDLGRIAKIGSVKVNISFGIQKTSHLIHIISDITGKLIENMNKIDALVSGFPAGTVSGAPKIRAMEIIDELESEKRGIYSGCIGYFSAGGDMDTCITLRTGIIKNGMLYVQAGAGIVHDSIPQSEFEETQNKAKVLFKAAEEALSIARQINISTNGLDK